MNKLKATPRCGVALRSQICVGQARQWAPPARASASSEPSEIAIRLASFMGLTSLSALRRFRGPPDGGHPPLSGDHQVADKPPDRPT